MTCSFICLAAQHIATLRRDRIAPPPVPRSPGQPSPAGRTSYRDRVGFAAAGFKVADLYMSADRRIRHELPGERDPELRRKIRQEAAGLYRELVELIRSPAYALGVRNSSLIDVRLLNDIREEIKYLEQGTTFGIGDFTYWGYYAHGGRTAMNAEVRTGWTYGCGGLLLPPETTGLLVYHFSAVDGAVFGQTRIKFMVFERHGTLSNELAVSTDDGRTYTTVCRNRNMNNVAASEPDETEQDITALVSGKREFLVKGGAHNSGNREVRSIYRIVFKGTLTPADDYTVPKACWK